MADDEHPVPRGLKAAGRRLWRSTVGEFVLAEHELALLLQVCRTADACDALQAIVDADGVLDESPQGRRAHPALVELRQQRAIFSRLIAQLGIPVGAESDELDDDDDQPRRGRRGGPVYGITGAAS
ncbi:terminase [Mycobacterium sp. TNTM28]|uniref:Terminase n=1 Tax=[Mycobacterium] fortunisiensis TaxID=2600579 RepID=A0ABS6KML8_9MYCO|nr:terminase [[Mycobacterium] fortunisiensis]MBU9764749.1 terminase [[Mycobacterium] fortunisiensis]